MGVKQLKSFLLQHPDWTAGNNLQETDIEVSLVGNMISAELICRNGLGSVFTTEARLDIKCPSCFIHLFKEQVLNIEI